MKIIKYMLAVILTVVMLIVDLIIIVGAAGVGLFDKLVSFNWQLDAIKDYMRDRAWSYSELWDAAMR